MLYLLVCVCGGGGGGEIWDNVYTFTVLRALPEPMLTQIYVARGVTRSQ